MSRAHEAGALHAEAGHRGPHWLRQPADVNALVPALWSATARRRRRRRAAGRRGAGHRARRRVTARRPTCSTRPTSGSAPRTFRTAFAGLRRLLRRQGVHVLGAARLGGRRGPQPRRLHRRRAGAGAARGLRPGADRPARQQQDRGRADPRPRRRRRSHHRRLAPRDRAAGAAGRAARRAPPRCSCASPSGVEAHTHEYIATAHEDQKFGFSIAGGDAFAPSTAC